MKISEMQQELALRCLDRLRLYVETSAPNQLATPNIVLLCGHLGISLVDLHVAAETIAEDELDWRMN
jgi:hypothetical protein